MKAQNKIGPFQPVLFTVQFRFTFLHSSPTTFVQQCTSLFPDLSKQNNFNKNTHTHTHNTATTSPSDLLTERPFSFDHLVDVREQVLCNVKCVILSPLQSKPGVVVVTAERFYFQLASSGECFKWPLRAVAATARRYKGLRDSALEIYWNNQHAHHRDTNTASASASASANKRKSSSTLFAFERRHDREQVMRFLPTVPCFTDREFVVQAVRQWQAAAISNFDYLLALNSAAGRSFHDLSRYPVFPWILADYTSHTLDLTNEATFRDLSKPVGALNQERLEYFRTRLESMQDMGEDFLYGTHYSAPGYVLYYLVRSMPEHMLCLQNGKYDAPDRMFHSIAKCFRCVLTNHADVKELIPEFFDPSTFDFLINVANLQLGATQTGERVNDVALPPWARSARDFLKQHRQALESDFVTRQLPSWIDLIFGYKSRGPAAKESCNLFHRTAYLGPTDLASMPTEEERHHAELQATEFGIVPDQLFVGRHPLQNKHQQQSDESLMMIPQQADMDDFISTEIGRASSKEDSREAWELLDPPSSLEDMGGLPQQQHSTLHLRSEDAPEMEDTTQPKISFASSLATDQTAAATNTKTTMPPNTVTPLRGKSVESVQGRNFDLYSSPQRSMDSTQSSPSPSSQQQQIAASPLQQFPDVTPAFIWDMKMIERSSLHTDAVSGCVLLLDDVESKQSILVTTSLDGGLKVQSVSMSSSSSNNSDDNSKDKNFGFTSSLSRFSYSTIMSRAQISLPTPTSLASQTPRLTEYRSHTSRDPLASLVLALDGSGGAVAFAGGHDDVVLAYGINSACAVASVYSHRDAVTGLDLIQRSPFDATCALWLENSTHIMISGSWDATVKMWSCSVAAGETVSVNREPLAELFDADSSIACVSAKSIPTGGMVIAAGCADGSFCVWNVHSDGVQVVIHHEQARRGSGPCSVVRWISAGGSLHLLAAFSTGKVASYTLVDGRVLERRNAVSVGVAVLSLVYIHEGFLLVGCADGGLRLIPLRDGAYFDAKPTLWHAVLNKDAPGISSISVTYYTAGVKQKGIVSSPTNRGSDDDKGRCICCAGGEDGSIALFELIKQPSGRN